MSEPEMENVDELVEVPVDVDVDVPVEVAEALPDEDGVEVDVPVEVAVAVGVEVEIDVPELPSIISQRYVVDATVVTDTRDRKSPASANTAVVSAAAFSPFSAVTVIAPPPSVSIRKTNRMPGLVGFASVRVSASAPDTISQIWRSAVGRIVPEAPGSASIFEPRYKR